MQQLIYELLHAYAAVGVVVCGSWLSSMREQGAAHASLRGDAYANCPEMQIPHKPTARRCICQLPGDADTA